MAEQSLPPQLIVTSIAERDTARLVSSGRLKPPVLDDLVDTAEERERIANLEMLTSARQLAASRGSMLDVAPDELLGERYGWGWTYINAAFCYTRHGGSRFNGPERGAWYASPEVETSQAEIAWHLTRELEATSYFHNVSDYGALLADFIGDFFDARQMPEETDFLSPDTAIAYPAGQALAMKLRAMNATGLIYPSARRRNGVCIAVFKPSAVQNLKQGGIWRFIWDGAPEPHVTSLA